jgi:hypothetical protein
MNVNINKKVVLIGSGIMALLFFLAIYYPNFLCQEPNDVSCSSFYEYFWMYTVLFVPVFIFSFITYFLQEKTFLVWRKFTFWWIVVIFLIVFILPGYSRNSLIVNSKETFVWFSIGAYIFFSSVLIIYKSIKLRGKK